MERNVSTPGNHGNLATTAIRSLAGTANKTGDAGGRNRDQLHSLTIHPRLWIKDMDASIAAQLLGRAYLLHPQAEDFEVDENLPLEVINGMLLDRIKKLTPDGYEFGFIFDEEDEEIKAALYGEIENEEFSMLEAELIFPLKKSNPKLYKFICQVTGKLLSDGLSTVLDFDTYDQESALYQALDESNGEESETQIEERIRREAAEHNKSVKRLRSFIQECRNAYKKSHRKFKSPTSNKPEVKKLIALGNSILKSTTCIGEIMHPITLRGREDFGLTPDQFIFLGMGFDSKLDTPHREHVDVMAQEGVLNPNHIIFLEDKNSWNLQCIDYGLISRFGSFANQLYRIN